MKISYQKHWSDDGTVYDQRIKMTEEEYGALQDVFYAEIARNYPRKKDYVFTSGGETYLKHLKREGSLVHLNLTQTRFANIFLKLSLKDRNTYLKII